MPKNLLSKLRIKAANLGTCSGPQQWLEDGGGAWLVSNNPTTGREIARVRTASPAAYETTVKRSRAAFESWRSVPAPQRGQLSAELKLAFSQAPGKAPVLKLSGELGAHEVALGQPTALVAASTDTALAEQAAQDAFAEFGLASLALLDGGAGGQLSTGRGGDLGDVLAAANTTLGRPHGAATALGVRHNVETMRAAGIHDDSGKLIAGLSISAPADRLQEDWLEDLVQTARQISLTLGYMPVE